MLQLRDRRLPLTPGRPLVMGILNVTPDSFSDGGRYFSADAAVARAEAMLEEGADMIDVGPESTRPGSAYVPAEEQIRRAVPVILRLRADRPDCVISIDTRLAPVAGAALEAGADMVNDVSALRDDPRLAGVVAQWQAGIVLMHMRQTPATMQDDPRYADVVAEVLAFLLERAAAAQDTGIPRERIVLDPGIGFGKTTEHNVALLRNLECFVATGYPLLVGASRKRFLGDVLGSAPGPASAPAEADGSSEAPEQGEIRLRRLGGSLACVVRAMEAGVSIVRVHDVRETRQLIDTLCAVRPPREKRDRFVS